MKVFASEYFIHQVAAYVARPDDCYFYPVQFESLFSDKIAPIKLFEFLYNWKQVMTML